MKINKCTKRGMRKGICSCKWTYCITYSNFCCNLWCNLCCDLCCNLCHNLRQGSTQEYNAASMLLTSSLGNPRPATMPTPSPISVEWIPYWLQVKWRSQPCWGLFNSTLYLMLIIITLCVRTHITVCLSLFTLENVI